jgi:hypothetical protein
VGNQMHVYRRVAQAYTISEQNVAGPFVVSRHNGSSAPSTRQSHPPPVRKGAHASVSTISKPGYAPDTRRLALLTYFRACSCPAAKWASTFIREADRNELDWRLVASIAMVESTGGKHYKNRNILGWPDCRNVVGRLGSLPTLN